MIDPRAHALEAVERLPLLKFLATPYFWRCFGTLVSFNARVYDPKAMNIKTP